MEMGWIVIGWIALHVLALVAAFMTRIATNSCLEQLAQVAFFAAMAAIGAVTWYGQQFHVDWTWSAITLMAMVLTAVTDFRRVSDPAPASISR